MAFAETFREEQEEFYNWLLKNGYPELAALSSAIRGSEEALIWLMQHKFYHLAALDGAIDKQGKARAWLVKFQFNTLAMLADAVNEQQAAIDYFQGKDLQLFLLIAKRIRDFRDSQTYDYHKKRF